jgi:hypothetical protein
MSPQQNVDLLELLRESSADLGRAVEVARTCDPSAIPSADCWSVLQCVEHVVAVEERFLDRLQTAERTTEGQRDAQREAGLAARIRDRSTKAVAPEGVQPKGRYVNLDEAAAQFTAVRERTIRYAEERSGELYLVSIDHPRFGRLNGVELLVLMASHAQRHADQIREIAGNLNR